MVLHLRISLFATLALFIPSTFGRKMSCNDACSKKRNRERCVWDNLFWEKLDASNAKDAAPMLRECGVVFFGQETIDPDGTYLPLVNKSAQELMANPESPESSKYANRDERRSWVVPFEAPFGKELVTRFFNGIGETLRLHFGGNHAMMNYAEFWTAAPGNVGQEIHTDDQGGSVLVFWTMNDLGTEANSKNGEYMAVPGCFNLLGEDMPEYCSQVEDQRLGPDELKKQFGMETLTQPRKAGFGLMYKTDMLHAGLENRSPKRKEVLTLSFAGTSKKDLRTSKNERTAMGSNYAGKARKEALHHAAQYKASWKGFKDAKNEL